MASPLSSSASAKGSAEYVSQCSTSVYHDVGLDSRDEDFVDSSLQDSCSDEILKVAVDPLSWWCGNGGYEDWKEGRLPKVLRFSIVDINSFVLGNGLIEYVVGSDSIFRKSRQVSCLRLEWRFLVVVGRKRGKEEEVQMGMGWLRFKSVIIAPSLARLFPRLQSHVHQIRRGTITCTH